MGTLVIYAHPKTKGHCPFIFSEVKKQLDRIKQEYEVIDLYKVGYSPTLRAEEHYTNGNWDITPENKKYQENIKNAEKLILIYPVWWGTMPAILKGFFDRVFVSRYAFKYDRAIPMGLLKGKKALVFMTSGANKVLSRVFQNPVHNIKSEILGFCGISTKVIQFGSCKKFTDGSKNRLEKGVLKAIDDFY